MEIKIAPHMINKMPKFPQKQNNDDMIFRAVKDVIDELDPLDLLKSGAPKDEFDAESRMIAKQIENNASTSDIAIIFAEVLNDQFSAEFKPEDFIGYAEKIKTSLNR